MLRSHSVRRALLLSMFLAACGYPEFKFAPPIVEDAGIDVIAGEDANIAEVSLDAASKCTATSCSGFDSVMTSPFGWDETNLTSGLGFLSLEPSGRSGNALFARSDPSPTGIVYASVQKNFALPSADASIDADMWIKLESATFAGQAAYLTKIAHGGDGVTLMIDASGLFADTPSLSFRIAKAVTVGAWFHVRILTKLHTTAGSLQIWIDDPSMPVVSKSGFATATADVVETKFVVGLYASKGTGTFRARYDDVSLTLIP